MSKDPYKYFRIEARELVDGLATGVLEIEKAGATKARITRLLRLAHTMKGAARVVKQPAIASAAHALEEVLGPLGELPGDVARETIASSLALIDTMTAGVAALGSAEGPAAKAPSTATPVAPPASTNGAPPASVHAAPPVVRAASVEEAPTPTHSETVRVEIHEMDAVLDGIEEAAIQADAIRRSLDALSDARRMARSFAEQFHARSEGSDTAPRGTALARSRALADELSTTLGRLERSLSSDVERAERELLQARDAASRLRLVQVSGAFGAVERAARDAADGRGKKIAFEATGGDVRVDGHVLGALREALMHLVTNAVAHGIEPEAERLAAGKPAHGTIRLSVARRGPRVAFLCEDDGRGVDVESVREAAVRKGILSQAAASELGRREALNLVFRPGVSTAKAVDHVSGRGIGLDVVHDVAVRLKGEVELRSEPGGGSAFELIVPASMTSLTVIGAEVEGRRAGIPLDAIARTVRVVRSQITRSPEGDTIVLDDMVIPFAQLAPLLHPSPAPEPRHGSCSAVVVRSGVGRGLVAVGVDRLLGTMSVVVRPTPASAGLVPLVLGASFDADGTPQLVLDPAGLAAAITTQRGARAAPDAVTRLPLLVIDDSLTTRMLEQSIFESAGYEVAIACSAEEGLAKAQARRYGVFIVDVEMPGMNGFEFVERTRADPILRDVPAILVTSLDAPEDRARGHRAGASDYIVKGEYDQERLLGTVRRLVGGGAR